MTLKAAFDRLLPQIETDLRETLTLPHPDLADYYGMMHYHLGWVDEALQPIEAHGGKRLRPVLCLLACESAGGQVRQALPAASAVELIHAFSLVHDDIEDASPLRRGRPAVWRIWGVARALNAGDGLFVLARLALHRLADRGVAPARREAATLAFDEACLALCEGQHFDMTFETRLQVELDQYLWMIRHKTATLLATSAQLGAIVASDDATLIRHYACFGENLGMAFQIQDDILGAWGDERVTGKSTATDLRDRKKTLPAVYALNQTDDPAAARELAALYARPEPLDEAAMRAALDVLDRVGARAYSEQVAAEYYRLALGCLEQAGAAGPAAGALHALAARLLGRAS